MELEELIDIGKRRHGDQFDASDIALPFLKYLHTDQRIRVRHTYSDGSVETTTGRIGITTGWKPVLLLMRRSNDRGSSYVLSDRDELDALQFGRQYLKVVS